LYVRGVKNGKYSFAQKGPIWRKLSTCKKPGPTGGGKNCKKCPGQLSVQKNTKSTVRKVTQKKKKSQNTLTSRKPLTQKHYEATAAKHQKHNGVSSLITRKNEKSKSVTEKTKEVFNNNKSSTINGKGSALKIKSLNSKTSKGNDGP